MSNFPAIPSQSEFATMKELALMAIKSKLLPAAIDTPEKAMIIMLKAREMEIPPMEAFSSFSVINGKPAMDAQAMKARVHKRIPAAVFDIIESTNERCVIEAKRPGGKLQVFIFSMEDAQRAGLLSKDPWKKFPANMLRARCISNVARAVFPDALSSVVHTPEELGADVNEEGEVVALPPEQPPRDVTQSQAPVSKPAPATMSPTPNVVIKQVQAPVKTAPAFTGTQPDAVINDAGSFEIRKAKKEWEGKTIREVVEHVGLPAFQKDVRWWAEESRNKDFTEVKALRTFATAYADEMKLKQQNPSWDADEKWPGEA